MAEHRDFDAPPLGPEDVDADPIVQFRRWYADAAAASVGEPEAMTVATTAPAARILYLRGVDARGFRFFTNRDSAKGTELAADPRVSLGFAWLPLHRTVRVTGEAELLPDDESDAYFAERPRGSQLGAWASPQSEVIPDRAALDDLVAAIEARFAATDPVPRPPFWGGYLVRPRSVELWQGRPSRLHDRLRYVREGDAWRLERLAP